MSRNWWWHFLIRCVKERFQERIYDVWLKDRSRHNQQRCKGFCKCKSFDPTCWTSNENVVVCGFGNLCVCVGRFWSVEDLKDLAAVNIQWEVVAWRRCIDNGWMVEPCGAFATPTTSQWFVRPSTLTFDKPRALTLTTVSIARFSVLRTSFTTTMWNLQHQARHSLKYLTAKLGLMCHRPLSPSTLCSYSLVAVEGQVAGRTQCGKMPREEWNQCNRKILVQTLAAEPPIHWCQGGYPSLNPVVLLSNATLERRQ